MNGHQLHRIARRHAVQLIQFLRIPHLLPQEVDKLHRRTVRKPESQGKEVVVVFQIGVIAGPVEQCVPVTTFIPDASDNLRQGYSVQPVSHVLV